MGEDKVIIPIQGEQPSKELTTDEIAKIVRIVKSKDGRAFQVLLVAFTALITWFTASGLVYRDFPKQSEIKEMRNALEKKIEERDARQSALVDKIQSDNLATMKQMREDQQKSVEKLNDSLEDLKMQFVKLQAEISTKEKYDPKNR